MSTTGENKRDLITASKRLWALGGLRACYRGLTVSCPLFEPVEMALLLMVSRSKVGLIGVFPYALHYFYRVHGKLLICPRYAAIDMSTFEALKLAYLRSTGKDEPGVLHTLAFGSVSGGVGATSVYPLNLVRTRLQASGTSGHPQRYTGIWDVTRRTYQQEGWKGYYRGLLPTLAKVLFTPYYGVCSSLIGLQ